MTLPKTGSSDTDNVAINTENILMYAKNIDKVALTRNPNSYNENRYKHKDKYYERRGPFYFDTLDRGGLKYSDSMNYGIEMPDKKILYPNGRREFFNDGWTWKWGKEKVEWGIKNGFCEFVKDSSGEYNIKYKVYLKVDNNDEIISRSAPWKNLLKGMMNTTASNELKKLFGSKVFSTPKPEELLNYLLSINTKPGDIVLDFFMGSATTQAVAMKMNLRFIGIEQMEYVNTVSVPRLQKVINGEQGGISKNVEWQGGGSFVYCELLEDGQRLIDKIQSASSETIQSVKDEIYHSEQIVPYILTSDLEKADKYFNTLSLEEQKQVLIELIDKNKLYVNYSSIDDEDYQISEGDKNFSRSFYEGGEVND
ncbi:DNA methyltransferase [Globicatella sanguinis]